MKFCIFFIEICRNNFISEKYTVFFILLKSACSFFEKKCLFSIFIFSWKMTAQYNTSFTVFFSRNMIRDFENKWFFSFIQYMNCQISSSVTALWIFSLNLIVLILQIIFFLTWLTACRCSADFLYLWAVCACWIIFSILKNHQLHEYFLMSLISSIVRFISCCIKFIK